MFEFAPDNLEVILSCQNIQVQNSQWLKALMSDSYKAVPGDTGVSLDCVKRQIITSVKA